MEGTRFSSSLRLCAFARDLLGICHRSTVLARASLRAFVRKRVIDPWGAPSGTRGEA